MKEKELYAVRTKEEEQGEDRLGRYTWVGEGDDKVIKYYPDHRRYACVHA